MKTPHRVRYCYRTATARERMRIGLTLLRAGAVSAYGQSGMAKCSLDGMMCLSMANSVLQSATEPRRAKVSARFVLAAACLLFCLQQLPYFQTRWIEDENSYS